MALQRHKQSLCGIRRRVLDARLHIQLVDVRNHTRAGDRGSGQFGPHLANHWYIHSVVAFPFRAGKSLFGSGLSDTDVSRANQG
jgi:hypothetical protein